MKKNILIILSLMLLAMNMVVTAQSKVQEKKKVKSLFSSVQTHEIQKIIKDYLVENPEILIEVSRALQQKQYNDMMDRAKKAIPNNAEKLFMANSPFVGNSKAVVNIVEFFDYQCQPCKKMHKVIKEVIEKNKNTKVIYKHLPIFGQVSEYAAKMMLAAGKQNKSTGFHEQLMAQKGQLTKEKIDEIAQKLQLNKQQLQKDMKAQEIEKELQDNVSLAQAIGITGTPAFVVANNKTNKDGKEQGKMKSFYVPGAPSYKMLEDLIKQAAS